MRLFTEAKAGLGAALETGAKAWDRGEAQTRLVRGGGEEGAETQEGAGLEGTGTGQRRAGVGWGRTLSCSSPRPPAELPIAAATGHRAGRDRNWEQVELNQVPLHLERHQKGQGSPGGPWLPEQRPARPPAPRAPVCSLLGPLLRAWAGVSGVPPRLLPRTGARLLPAHPRVTAGGGGQEALALLRAAPRCWAPSPWSPTRL